MERGTIKGSFYLLNEQMLPADLNIVRLNYALNFQKSEHLEEILFTFS
jgi:hypothetical protein